MAAYNLVLLLLWGLLRIQQVVCLTIPDHHPLHDALDHFEVLHARHILHRTPPHPHTSTLAHREMKHLYFRILEKDFNLILTPSRDSLHHSVHISVVTEGRAERRHFPFHHFYTGHLRGVENSSVVAHLHPTSGTVTAIIHTPAEQFYVEPLFRHFNESCDSHMIAYKHSHLKFNLTGQSSQHFCGNREHQHWLPQQQISPWQQALPYDIDPTLSGSHFTKSSERNPHSDSVESPRLRRDLAGDVCTMHLVATPSFHNQYSSGDPDTTTLYMLNVLGDIDQNIFQKTVFESNRPQLGMVITNITIYTDNDGGNPAYAQDREGNSEKLLKLFSGADWSGVCLAHLFTATEFQDNRLGVAYVSSDNRGDTGGICSPLVTGNSGMETANVGISAYRNAGDRLLLMAEARLVTAHEIGHGWGSEHDPESVADCNPPVGRYQGKYLMFPSATDGNQDNNERFSPCSITKMSDVVDAKGKCFQERSQLVGRCGNYRLEEGEECDAGALGKVGADLCCTENCKLRNVTSSGETVECSDVNDACCKNCHVLSPDSKHECLVHRPGNALCLRSVLCAGEKRCPTVLTPDLRYVPSWTSCGQDGRCLPKESDCTIEGNCTAGEEESQQCFNFCEWHNLEECFCTGRDECRFCCLQTVLGTGNVTCRPFMDSLRPDRSSCFGGFCESGECQPASQDLIQRLFELFDNPDIDTFVQFMQENIVGSVIFFTAVLWFPLAFFVHIFDVYRWRRHKRVALEYEAQLEEAELEDAEDLNFYDDVFEEMEQTRPGVLRPEAKIGLMRLDSGTNFYFGDDCDAPLTPTFSATSPMTPPGGMGGHRLSTITEETSVLNPEMNNILAFMTPKSSFDDRSGPLQQSSLDIADNAAGTLV